MMMIDNRMEFSLLLAQRAWDAPQTGLTMLEKMSDSIRICADFHPKYHFLESWLHCARGADFLKTGDWEQAAADFARAIWLDHTNETALMGQKSAAIHQMNALPEYSRAAKTLSQWAENAAMLETADHQSIHALAAEKRWDEALALCHTTHQQYHRLACLTWLARARYFMEIKQWDLAKNDLRRAYDLDKNNAQIEELKKQIPQTQEV